MFSFRMQKVIGVGIKWWWWWGQDRLCLACPVPCLQPLSLGLEFAPWPPHWLQQAPQTFLTNLRTSQSCSIQDTLLEPRRNVACCKQIRALLNLVRIVRVHLYGIERLCRGEGDNNSHPQPSGDRPMMHLTGLINLANAVPRARISLLTGIV